MTRLIERLGDAGADPDARIEAARALVAEARAAPSWDGHERAAAAAALGRALREDGDAGVRLEAFTELGKVGPEAGPQLLGALAAARADASPLMWAEALSVVRRVGPAAAGAAFAAALRDGADRAPEQERKFAASFMGSLPGGEVAAADVEALAGALRRDPSGSVRCSAARSLGELRAGAHAAALARALGAEGSEGLDDDDGAGAAGVRAAAAKALGGLGEAALPHRAALEAAAGGGGGGAEAGAARDALDALRAADKPDDAAALAALVAEGGQAGLRAGAALAGMGPAEVAPHARALCALVESTGESFNVRVGAAEALGALGQDAEAAAAGRIPLQGTTPMSVADVQREIVRRLTAVYEERLDDDDEDVLIVVEGALTRMGHGFH